jgi:membrane protease YdiL (CAAX protease family)
MERVTFLLEHDGLRDRLAVAAIALIAAPLTEELVFRGCFYGVLRQVGGRWLAIGVTAVVFALIHGHAASIPGLLILAVALALLYEVTGSLWAPLALHAVFNGLSLLGTILGPEAMQ